MTDQKFTLMLQTVVSYSDDNSKGKYAELSIRRKHMSILPNVGSRVQFGEFYFKITDVSFPLSFDIVTCTCRLDSFFATLTLDQVTDLIKKHGWREIFKNGDHPTTVLLHQQSEKISSSIIQGIPLLGEPLGDKFEWNMEDEIEME